MRLIQLLLMGQFILLAESLFAQVPQIINYQGHVTVKRKDFDGIGQFKFSLVNSNGTLTFWSNDGSASAGAQPATALPIAVDKGLFSVSLGDTSLPNMTPIPPTIFTNSDVRLRIWVDDGQHGLQQLTPDQRITAVGYAMAASSAATVADGAVTSEKLAPGAVGAAQLSPGAAAANLLAGSQSAVPSGGIVLSLEENSPALTNVGYVNIGTLPINASEWETRSTEPIRRFAHTAVWTGTEMIVWGGGSVGSFLNDGGRYNPATDSWQPVSLVDAPSGRWYHTAVWTGTEMLIWGGRSHFAILLSKNDGGRYNPVSNSWTAISTQDAPSPRSWTHAVWTGSEMLVWGGVGDGNQNLGNGGRYNPRTDTWTPMATNGAPEPRSTMAVVWTGDEMIIWGGGDMTAAGFNQSFNSGARYKPSTDTWTPISTNGAPPPAANVLGIWTGREMIVWGGVDFKTDQTLNTGGRYNPATDTWAPLSMAGAPRQRDEGSAVWTEQEMVVWGGDQNHPYEIFNDGARYNPATDRWTALSSQNAPSARLGHSAVWTGHSMLIFGGYNNQTGANELNSNHSWAPANALYLYQRR